MNIFATSTCPVECARVLDDKRLNKMTLESAQLLSTALYKLGYWQSNLYRETHENHPSVLWATRSRGNFNWLVLHALALGSEYKHRFGRTHRAVTVVLNAAERFKACPLDTLGLTPFPNLTDFKSFSVLDAYKLHLQDKWMNGTPKWTRRDKPEFFNKRVK